MIKMNSCCLCKSKRLVKIFDLGIIPLGYPIEKKKKSLDVWKKKLEILICKKCLLAQTLHKVPEKKLASEIHYHTVSKVVTQHNNHYAKIIEQILTQEKNPLILEIGCSNGSLLNALINNGYSNVIGIEPSVHKDIKYDFEVITDFFNAKTVRRLKKDGKNPDLIISNYTIENIPRLGRFFKDLANLSKNGSYVIIEVPYLIDFIKNFRIDAFDHLDCNWFTVNSLLFAFKNYGFQVLDIKHDTNYRGGTFVVIAKKAKRTNIAPTLSAWAKEERKTLHSDFFRDFGERIYKQRKMIRNEIDKLLKKKISIYGYGGGLKASTLINWLGLTQKEIKMVVDADHNKQNKIMPITNIPIKPVSDLQNNYQEKIAILIFALDYVKDVIPMLKQMLRKNSIIINPLPRFNSMVIK